MARDFSPLGLQESEARDAPRAVSSICIYAQHNAPCRSQKVQSGGLRPSQLSSVECDSAVFRAHNRTCEGLDHARDREVAICRRAMDTADPLARYLRGFKRWFESVGDACCDRLTQECGPRLRDVCRWSERSRHDFRTWPCKGRGEAMPAEPNSLSATGSIPHATRVPRSSARVWDPSTPGTY
jgi:hypothetical protein